MSDFKFLKHCDLGCYLVDKNNLSSVEMSVQQKSETSKNPGCLEKTQRTE